MHFLQLEPIIKILLPSNWYSSLQGVYDTSAHDQQWELSPQTFSFKSASALHIYGSVLQTLPTI